MLQTFSGIRLPLQSGRKRLRSLFVEGIIGVAASVESVKRVSVVSIQRQPEPDARSRSVQRPAGRFRRSFRRLR